MTTYKSDSYYIFDLPRITFVICYCIWHHFIITFGTLITNGTKFLLHLAPIITFITYYFQLLVVLQNCQAFARVFIKIVTELV